MDFGLYSAKLSFSITRLWLVNLRFRHSCVERHLEEQGNLFRAPYFINENIDIWADISCLTFHE